MTTRPALNAMLPTTPSSGLTGTVAPAYRATPRAPVRGIALALGAVAALSMFVGLTESLHVARLAAPVEVVQLERVIVYGDRAAAPTAVVRAESGTRSN